jgi:glycine cleavage system H protein
MNIPADLKYSKTHEWVRVQGSEGVIGITDFAQRELGDVVYVELPKVGQKLKAGEACAVVESVKAASDIYSPVTGTVTKVNTAMTSDTGLVNHEPYGNGWFFAVQLEGKEVESLLKPEDYQSLVHAGA